jgi:ABC-type multidrug transport system fused ATPase/permease subunit
MEAAGLTPAAYWAGTGALSVSSSLASAAFLVLTAVLLRLFSPVSCFALLFLAGAFALSLVALGFFIAAAFRSSRSVGAAVAATQMMAPLVFVPITWFGGSGAALGVCSLLSPVAFAAAMDVAVQAEAGAEPLTLANMASQTVGRDTATGGAGGEHPLTAAGAFGMLVLDTLIYAALAWYAESARQWGDAAFMFRREFWLGTPLLTGVGGPVHYVQTAGGGGDGERSVAVEMEDPTQGGRVEVLLDDADDGAGNGGVFSSSAAPRRRPRPQTHLAPSIKLVDVFATDEVSEKTPNTSGGGGGGFGGGGGNKSSTWGTCLPSLCGGNKSSSTVKSGGGKYRRNVVDGVTLSAYDGQVLALLGHSGSGKSALLVGSQLVAALAKCVCRVFLRFPCCTKRLSSIY